MQKLKCSLMLTEDGGQCASVIPVDSILSSVHLFFRFGQNGMPNVNSFTVIDNCHSL